MSSTTPPSDVPEARSISRAALREAERLSGTQVTVVETQSVPTISTIHFARGSAPGHVIEYRHDYAWAVDYLVVFHCGMLRRRVSAAASGPVDLGPSPTGLKAITGTLPKAVIAKIGQAAARQFATQLLEGVVVHLRSIPLALAVDSSIETELEALRETQRRVLANQLRENEQALDAAGSDLLPQRLVDATCAISAALALFWAERWDQPGLAAPYQYSGHAATGGQLLDVWRENVSDGERDHLVIDAWAQLLGISGWYAWLATNDDHSKESERR